MKKTTTGLSLTANLSKLNNSAFSGITKQSASAGLPNSSGIHFGMPSNRKGLLQASSTGIDWAQLSSKAASGGLASALPGHSGNGALSKLILGPLLSGIAGLFGGNKAKSQPALQLFQLPDAVNRTAHFNNSPALRSNSGSGSNGSTVHVHVQAMDSQSFLNRSNDIAKAVKSAMLNSHSLNDVVSEL